MRAMADREASLAADPSGQSQAKNGEGLQVFAPAKINLYLHLTGRRTDGYHLLDSLFAFARDLGDGLALVPDSAFSFSLVGPQASALSQDQDGDNLVVRAALGYWRALGREGQPPLKIRLDKRLPVAAGLGGGSSDAAACLRAMAGLYGPLPQAELMALALSLGADVPACLVARAQWVSGIGEICQPLPPSWPGLFAVLVQPAKALSTPAVFKARRQHGDFRSPLARPEAGLAMPDWIAWLAEQSNDLQEAASALEPSIATVLAAITEQAGCRFARLSGSGASCFGIFSDADSGQQAAAVLKSQHPQWWVGASRLM